MAKKVARRTLAGKSILILGGTSGLGLSAAAACQAAGALLTVVGLEADGLDKAAARLGQNTLLLQGDARDSGFVDRAVSLAAAHHGGLDGLFHVVGGSGRPYGDGPLHEIHDDAWARTLQLNLDTVFYSNRAAVRCFLRQARGGVILNTSSVLAVSPAPRFFPTHGYATAKAAILGITRAIAAYYAPYSIRANALLPGLIDTPMSRRAMEDAETSHFVRAKQPLDGGRPGTPTDVDGAVVFLLSDSAKFITGQTLHVDGGWSVTDAYPAGPY